MDPEPTELPVVVTLPDGRTFYLPAGSKFVTIGDVPITLQDVTAAAFAAYNAGGPPERANLTHDGKPVPSFEKLSPSVVHKWQCAVSTAALAGADHVIALVAESDADGARLRAAVHALFGAPPWTPPATPNA